MESDESPEDRLETALERIAQIMQSRNQAGASPAPVTAEVAARLDRIIESLREALGK